MGVCSWFRRQILPAGQPGVSLLVSVALGHGSEGSHVKSCVRMVAREPLKRLATPRLTIDGWIPVSNMGRPSIRHRNGF